MNNDLISRSALKKAIAEATYNFEQIPIRVDEVQEIIDNTPTVEFPFVHVKFKHPRFGECDGWLDKQRQLLFFDFITTELAQKYNWTWKEDEA